MKHITFEAAQPGITQVDRMSRQIAMEAGLLSSLTETLSTSLPRLLDQAIGFFGDVSTRLGFTPTTLNNPSAFVRHLNKVGYSTLSQFEIHVPEGFHGNLSEYAVFLEDSTDHTSALLNGVLNPYRDFLAGLVGNADSLKSARDPLTFLVARDKAREQLNVRASTFFKPGSVSTLVRMSAVVDRVADWDVVFTKLQAVDRVTQAYKVDEIKKVIAEISDLLDVLKEEAASGRMDSINPKQLKGLGTATLSAAQEVEFLAVSRHRIVAFATAMEANIEHIEEIA
jgi:hypothetical protein